MNTTELISNRILQLCTEKSITIGKLCTMSGSTGSTISDIVNGVTKNPGVLTIKKLCDALDITLAQFFDTPEFNNLQQELK